MFAQTNNENKTLPVKDTLENMIKPEIQIDKDTITNNAEDFDFLFKGVSLIENSVYFGDFYNNMGMGEIAINYYSMALQMCETLNGYEGEDFSDQIKKLKAIIAKLNK